MGHRDKLKNGDEVDAILARHVYCYIKNRPINVKRVKRAINKRLRKGAKMAYFIDVSGEGLYKHAVGNEYCQDGWCDCVRYPRKCKCGGLIHADFGDENMDCDYWVYEKCDKCGDKFEEA